MKLIKFEIEDDRLLNITCKRTRFNYLEEIRELEENMKSKDLEHKYFGCGRDIDGNIVFAFRLLNIEKDIKPYIKYSSPEEISLLDMRTDENIKLQNNWNELKKWLEECLNEIKQNDVYDRTSYENGEIIAIESVSAKMQELEDGKNGY